MTASAGGCVVLIWSRVVSVLIIVLGASMSGMVKANFILERRY